MTAVLHRRALRAMGTTIELVLNGVSSAEADQFEVSVGSRVEIWEQRFSRFRPESELCQVNRSSGGATQVSREFIEMLLAARDGYVFSGGRFDPTILSALESAGYDRPFAELESLEVVPMGARLDNRLGQANMLDISIDESASTVTLPPGMRIDFGGIAKGAFVDSLTDLLHNVPGGIVNAGGDLLSWGYPSGGDYWLVSVQHPAHPDRDIAQIRLPGGRRFAVATSSTHIRAWKSSTSRHNHVIDPRTGQSVPGETPSVTVVSDSVTRAEIEAKSILIAQARHEEWPYVAAHLVLLAFESGRVEWNTSNAAAA